MSQPQAADVTTPGQLKRELGFLETIALSIGISAPTAVLALNGVLPASLVGKATPLAFLFAAIGIALVAYVFIRFSQKFASAGSVYSFAGKGWGPRAGFFGGWGLMGAYIAFTIGSLAEVGLFFGGFLGSLGVSVDWLVIALVAGVVVWFLLFRDIRIATRALLSIEGLSLLGILALFAVIYVKLFSGTAPAGQTFTLSPFDPSGLDFSAIALASVAGFLSFVGFEGAATLGEESRSPRRTIPRAIAIYVITLGLVFTLGMFTETLGFGVGAEGVKAFAGSASPLDDLSKAYVGSWLGEFILLGASFSAFASAIGTGAAASRILMSLGRDGFLSPRLGRTRPTSGAPANAASALLAVTFVALISLRVFGTTAVNAFFYPATIGVFLILAAYAVTNLAGITFFFVGRRVTLWQVLIPIVGILVVLYTAFVNVYPVPAFPYNTFPYIAAGWLIVGAALVILVPGLARRVGLRLTQELEGESGADPVGSGGPHEANAEVD